MLIAECEKRWGLQVLPPFPLSYNYVAPVRLPNGAEAVLKLGVPNPELTTEIEALRCYGGAGSVLLFDADPENGILLMERVRPGTPLAQLGDDDAATLIAANVMRRLWRPLSVDHPFPDLRRWTRSLRRCAEHHPSGDDALPAHLVASANDVLADLLASQPPPTLIHGDFHHWNILQAEREPWLAIDPKGVAAEPAFEVGPLIYNPLPGVLSWPDIRRVTARRLDLLADHLALDRQRLAACAFVATMLSACWDIEDSGAVPPGFLLIAEVLNAGQIASSGR